MTTPGLDADGAKENRELTDALRRSKLFRSYEQVFSEATGLPLALRPVDYWQLEHQGKKNENPFCALLAERPATLAVCLQAHEEMIRHTGDLPHTVTCPFGLTETAVPIKLGQRNSDSEPSVTCESDRSCVTLRPDQIRQK